jgi:hypothetical protein
LGRLDLFKTPFNLFCQVIKSLGRNNQQSTHQDQDSQNHLDPNALLMWMLIL